MALSSLGPETGSGCRRVGRGLASHDGVGWLPTRPLGAAMLGAELLSPTWVISALLSRFP